MAVLNNNSVAEKISGVEEFEEASILLGLDITITDGTNTYNPKELSPKCRISKHKYEGKVTIWD